MSLKQLSSTCHVLFLAAPDTDHKHKFYLTHFIHFSCLSDGLSFTNKPDDYRPIYTCDVPRQSGGSTQIPSLTFSYAMALMDKIQDGTTKRKGWDPNSPHACGSTTKGVDKRTKTESSNGGVFEEANVVHYAMHELGSCWNFRGSRAGVRKYNFLSLWKKLDYEFDIPCVVQWSKLWFSAPTRLNGILGKQDLKVKKYHEVVDIREHTPRSGMLTSVAKVLHRTHRKCGVNKEMEGWMMEGSIKHILSAGDDDSDESSDE